MFFEINIYGKYKLNFKTIYEDEEEKAIGRYQKTVTGAGFINIIIDLLNDVNILSFKVIISENLIVIEIFNPDNGRSFTTEIKYEEIKEKGVEEKCILN